MVQHFSSKNNKLVFSNFYLNEQPQNSEAPTKVVQYADTTLEPYMLTSQNQKQLNYSSKSSSAKKPTRLFPPTHGKIMLIQVCKKNILKLVVFSMQLTS